MRNVRLKNGNMLQVKIENEVFTIPEKWAEVTVRQYDQMCRYADDLNYARLLSILTGIEYDTLNNYDCNQFVVNVFPVLEYAEKVPDFKTLKRAETITIGGRVLPIIKDPSKERIGQKLLMTSVLGNGENIKLYEVIPFIVANYYAPKLHPENKWDEQHVQEVKEQVMGMPILDAVAEANFFLIGYIQGLKRNQSSISPRRGKMRVRRVSDNLTN